MIYKILLGLIITFTIGGCAGKYENKVEKYTKPKYLELFGTVNSDAKKLSKIQNLAIFLKYAATYYKTKNIKYFKFNQAPHIITDMESLVSYCFPSNNGYHVSDFRQRDTSLEDGKCALTEYNHAFILLGMREVEKRELSTSVWSVEEVLTDKVIDEYINAAIIDGGIKDWKDIYKVIETKVYER